MMKPNGLEYLDFPDYSKNVILLPAGMSPPEEGVMPPGLAVAFGDPDKRGISIGGARVGPQDFILDFAIASVVNRRALSPKHMACSCSLQGNLSKHQFVPA